MQRLYMPTTLHLYTYVPDPNLAHTTAHHEIRRSDTDLSFTIFDPRLSSSLSPS